jgi:hypothetical protein
MSLPNSYILGVPQGNQQVNNTQSAIEGNFQDIASLLAVNHIPFNTNDIFGRHSKVEYINQSVDPSTLSNEMALYSKSVINDPNECELFYRYPNNGNIVQLTGITSSPNGGSGISSGGTFEQYASNGTGVAQSGSWQILSNGVIFISFIVSNLIFTNTTSPYVFYFPTGTYNGGVVVPTFTQTPFNVQIVGQFEGNNGTNVNFAAVATSNTQGLMYYNGAINPNSSIASVFITLIGI